MPHNTFYTQSGARVVIFFDIRKQNPQKTTNIFNFLKFL